MESFVSHNPIETMDRYRTALAALFGAADNVFLGQWTDDSIWHYTDFLLGNFIEYRMDRANTNIEDAYPATVVQLLDLTLLQQITTALDSIGEQFANPQSGALDTASSLGVPGNMEEMLQELGVDATGIESFLVDYRALPVASQQSVFRDIQALADTIDDIAPMYDMVAGALLITHSDRQYASFEQFEIGMKQTEQTEWVAVARYLGQALFATDVYAEQWALKFLSSVTLDKAMWDVLTSRFLFVASIFLVFKNFDAHDVEVQHLIINRYGWFALTMGVPVESIITYRLAREPLIDFYILASGGLAEQFATSTSPISIDAKTPIGVSEFLKRFSMTAKEKEFDGYTQLSFVDSMIQEYGFPSGLKTHLLKLITISFHLRECDLVDWHGILAIEGIKGDGLFDWKSALKQDITEEVADQIREYLSLMHRPAFEKMRILNAAQSLPWQEAAYVHRLLAISEIYEAVSPPEYGTLVFFDETDGAWRLNRFLPELAMYLEGKHQYHPYRFEIFGKEASKTSSAQAVSADSTP